MSTGDSNDGDESTPQLPAIVFRELVETERARIEMERAGIERDNRRSQVAEKELAVVDAQDQRQFEYASATRDANLQQLADRQAFMRRFAWVSSGFSGSWCSRCWASPSLATTPNAPLRRIWVAMS